MTQRRLVALAIVLLLWSGCAAAAIQLGAPFGEHMVLPQGVPVTIWGTGCPGGDTVRVSIAGQSVTAKSDWVGRWTVQLAPLKAGGPYQMLIEVGGYGPVIPSPAANARGGAELNDVLVGEVVPASSLSEKLATEHSVGAIGSGAHPYAWIRVYRSPVRTEVARGNITARWSVVSDDPAARDREHTLSLARELYNKLHVPIGVIDTVP